MLLHKTSDSSTKTAPRVPHHATTCHFFAIFRKNHHFFSKNNVFLCQKRQDARPVFSLFFIQIIFPATYCGCKDIYRYR